MKLQSRSAFMTTRAVIPVVLLIGALSPAGTAYAQQETRIGRFLVRQRIDPITDEDLSIAFLSPNEPAGNGMVAWACGSTDVGLIIGVVLTGYSRDDASRLVVWRFDRDKPDTTFVTGLSGGQTWFLREEDRAPFTIRAKTASRLVIRDLGDQPGSLPRDYIYDLNGSNSALNRLSCARNPRILGRPVAETIPIEEEDTTPLPEVEGTYELSAVEELPRPTNTAEFLQSLKASYPPLLWDARVSGTVQVRFRVMETGVVDANSITITSSTNERFNDAAIRAVRTLVFRPGRVNGRPVRVWVEQPIQFTPPQE